MPNHEVPKSVFRQAAELPPGAPHILGLGETALAPDCNMVALVVIDIDALEEDLRDRDWRDFLRRAHAHYKELDARGRIS